MARPKGTAKLDITPVQREKARTRLEVLRLPMGDPELVPENEREMRIKYYHQQHRRFLSQPEFLDRYRGSALEEAVVSWIAEKCILADVVIEDALTDLQRGTEEKISPMGGVEVIKMDQASKKQLAERINLAAKMKDGAMGVVSSVTGSVSSSVHNTNVNHSVGGTMMVVPQGFNPPRALAQLTQNAMQDSVEGELSDGFDASENGA